MNGTRHFAAASFVLALIATTGALAAPPLATLPSVGTLTIPAPFGSSPVLAWSWGESNPGSLVSGEAGKVSFTDLTITRYADGQSPLFFQNVAEGRHLETVVLVDASTTITLAEVLVTSYQIGASPDGNNTSRSESVSFRFAKMTYTVNGVTTCYNVKLGTPC